MKLDHDRKVGGRDDPVAVLAAAKDDAVCGLVEGQPTVDRLVNVDPDKELGVGSHPADHTLLAKQPLGEVHVVPVHAKEPLLEDRLHVLHVRSVDRHLRRCLECERLALLLADARHAVSLRCANIGAVDNETPLVISVHDIAHVGFGVLAHVGLGVLVGPKLPCVAYEFAQPRPVDLRERIGEGHPAISIDGDSQLDGLVPEQLGEQLGEVDVVRWSSRAHSIARASMEDRCGGLDYSPRVGSAESAATVSNAINATATLSCPLVRLDPYVLGILEFLLKVDSRRRGRLFFGDLRLLPFLVAHAPAAAHVHLDGGVLPDFITRERRPDLHSVDWICDKLVEGIEVLTLQLLRRDLLLDVLLFLSQPLLLHLSSEMLVAHTVWSMRSSTAGRGEQSY